MVQIIRRTFFNSFDIFLKISFNLKPPVCKALFPFIILAHNSIIFHRTQFYCYLLILIALKKSFHNNLLASCFMAKTIIFITLNLQIHKRWNKYEKKLFNSRQLHFWRLLDFLRLLISAKGIMIHSKVHHRFENASIPN